MRRSQKTKPLVLTVATFLGFFSLVRKGSGLKPAWITSGSGAICGTWNVFFWPMIFANVLGVITDPSGKVHPEITNKNGNPNYKYFYSNAEQGKDCFSCQAAEFSSILCDFVLWYQLTAVVSLCPTVVSGMKEAQGKLTGDAFKQTHSADELWPRSDSSQAVRANNLLQSEPGRRSSQPRDLTLHLPLCSIFILIL